MKLRIRMDIVNDKVLDVLNRLTRDATSYVLVKHEINDNPHYHMYLDNPMYMSCQSVRYYLKKVANQSTDYSVKNCDDDKINEYVSYLFNTKKGNVPTLVDSKFDEETLKQCQSNAERIASEFAAKLKAYSKPKSLYDIAMYVHHECEENGDSLIIAATRALHKFCKIHDEFLVTKVITTILTHRDETFLVERVRRKLSNP